MSKSFQWMMKVEERVGAVASDTSSTGTIKMDPAFKLFGKTIAVATTAAAAAAAPGFSDAGADAGVLFGMRATHWATAPFYSQKNGNNIAMAEDEQNPDELRSSSGSNSGVDDDSNQCPVMLKTTGLGPSGAEPYVVSAGPLDQALTQITEEDGEDDDKTLHKLQGKVVACPRCDSADTKFCYYNNYNINQPRHFCKNCQRYWTAGGSLRNVPVGAGRRKNKHSGIHGSIQTSGDGQIVEPVYQGATQIDLSDGTRGQTSHKASALNIPQPRNLGLMADQSSSPLISSPGGSTDSCLTVNMNSPFPLNLSGSASLNPFAATHNTMAFKSTSGETGIKLSSDSPTRLRQMIKASSPMNGALSSGEMTTEHGTPGSSKEDVGSSLTGSIHTVIRDGHVFQHQQSPAVYHQSMTMGNLGGWTSNGTPFSFFSGAWPYGYNVGWNGLPPVPSTTTFCTATPGSLGCNPPSPNSASWCPAPGTLWTGAPWAPGIPGTPVASGVVSETNLSFAVSDAASRVSAATSVSGTCGVPWGAQGWNLKAPGGIAGKRVSPEGGKIESMWGPKSMRTDHKTNSNEWNNRVGIKTDPDCAGTLSKTFNSKMENQTPTSKQFYNAHMFVNTMQFQETVT